MNPGKSIRGILLALAVSPAFAQTTTTEPPPGRLLASNCYQCHGTNGSGGFEKLAGMSSGEIFNELREMQQKTPPKMMDMHARAFTDAQLRLLADYFSRLR